MEYERLREHVVFQSKNREHWTETDTALGLAKYLRDEVDELIEVIEMAEIGAGAYEVASELGDVQYLLIRLGELTEIDPVQAGEMKAMRNAKKYDDHLMNNGYDPKEAQKLAKEMWEITDSERLFSIAYMKLAEDL